MLKKITITHNQSLFDVAIQETGGIESVFEIALANDLQIAENLTAGNVLKIEEEAVDQLALNYFTSKGIKPATGITGQIQIDLGAFSNGFSNGFLI